MHTCTRAKAKAYACSACSSHAYLDVCIKLKIKMFVQPYMHTCTCMSGSMKSFSVSELR